MHKMFLNLFILMVGFSLAGCSNLTESNDSITSDPSIPPPPAINPENTMPETNMAENNIMTKPLTTAPTTLAGDIEKTMDQNDKVNLSHALDKPLRRATEWENQASGYHYKVIPIGKLVLNGNPFCRRYTVIATKNEAEQEVTSVACVSATDSSWQVVQ